MSASDTPKKRPIGRNDYPAENWHAADVQAELRKAGWTFRRLAKHHGYASVWITKALYEPAPMAEGIIAEAIGVHPKEIWPTRYDHAGNPKVPIKRGRVVPKNIPPREGRHVPNRSAA
jgi:Ner family transcriptional regulator